jgi:hypothetical protein
MRSHFPTRIHPQSGIPLTAVEALIGIRVVRPNGFCRLSLVLQEGFTTTAILVANRAAILPLGGAPWNTNYHGVTSFWR